MRKIRFVSCFVNSCSQCKGDDVLWYWDNIFLLLLKSIQVYTLWSSKLRDMILRIPRGGEIVARKILTNSSFPLKCIFRAGLVS